MAPWPRGGHTVLLFACGGAFLPEAHAAPTQLLTGAAGWALLFDGINDFCALMEELPFGPATVEMWVQPKTVLDGLGNQIAKYNPAGVLLDLSETATAWRGLSIPYNGGEVWHRYGDTLNIKTASVDPHVSNALYHYAYVRSATNYTVLLNGAVAGTGRFVPNELTEAFHYEPWLLGARADYIANAWVTNNRCFGGMIDSVRWWDHDRTSSELRRFMVEPVPENTDGLIRQWLFDTRGAITDGVSFNLGYGNPWTSPQYVPSTLPAFGSPVAVASALGERAQPFQICACLVPAMDGAVLVAQFVSSPTLGTLTPSRSLVLAPNGTDSGGRGLYCANVSFQSSAAGFEAVPFNVTANLPDGGTLTASQAVEFFVRNNTPPVAGNAGAVEPNGIDGYVSLGQFDVPPSFTISFWMAVVEMVEGAAIISRHRTVGDNLLLMQFTSGGYYLQIQCFGGCSPTGQLVSDTFRVPFPGRDKPHQVAISMNCFDTGKGGNKTRARLTFWVDGQIIGRKDNFGACMVWPPDVAPWELGQEYDKGTDSDPIHLPGLQVVTSQFNHARFDEVIFWGEELSADSMAVAARGGVPRPESLVARYTFDLDNPKDCADRQLWDRGLECYPVNEADMRVRLSPKYPWTNAFIGGVARVPSPFPQLRGSPIHVTMQEGTCGTAVLKAADADGDAVAYKPYGKLPPGVALNGSKLVFCAGDGAGETTVQFDACDKSNACSADNAGPGEAIFHVLKRGPNIIRFQALTSDRVLRVVFDVATNTPLCRPENVSAVFAMGNGSLPAAFGSWEQGGKALRLQVTDASWSFEDALQVATIRVLAGGLLRDAEQLSYPSKSTSPPLVAVNCPPGQLLRPSVADCEPCLAGQVPVRRDSVDVCEACQPGRFSNGTRCDLCYVGTYAESVGQEACTSCAQNASSQVGWATLQRVAGVSQWVPVEGAQRSSSCGCIPGTYEQGGECRPCAVGLVCLGKGDVLLEEGFWSAGASPDSVFRCFGNAKRCPGGPPGACAPNRDTESITCASCVRGMRSGDSGACEACAKKDYAPMAILAVVAFGFLYAMYRAMGRKSRAMQPMTVMLAATTSGHFIALMQQLGILAVILVDWPEPLDQVFSWLRVLTFDIQVLSIDCVAAMSPLVLFAVRVFLVMLFVVVMLFIHVLHMVIAERGKCGSGTSALTASIGTIVMGFFVSIVSNLSAPLHCDVHPNGLSTVHSFPTVICWNDAELSLHSRMVGLGGGACILPAAFVALAVSVAWRLPHQMAIGNVEFLQVYTFLLFRFRAGGQWFAVLSVVRSFLVALIPIVPDVPTQLVLLWAVLVVSLIVTAHWMPWRAPMANAIDSFLTVVVLLILVFGAFCVPDVSRRALGVIAVVLIVMGISVVVGVILGCFINRVRARGRKRFTFFLCHHKCASGSFARLLQMALLDWSPTEEVFIDSDNLFELDELFICVANEVSKLLVISSKMIMYRAWCVGEITTATLNTVPVVPIFLPDFVLPTQDFIDGVTGHIEFECLARHSLDVAAVQAALRDFCELPHITMQSEVSLGVVTALAHKLALTGRLSVVAAAPARMKAAGDRIILADGKNPEAISTALVLMKLLVPMYVHEPELVPILYQDADLAPVDFGASPSVRQPSSGAGADKVDTLIVLCTEGCFAEVSFLEGLMWARQAQVPFALPVVAREDFRFPTPEFYDRLHGNITLMCHMSEDPCTTCHQTPSSSQDMPELLTEYVRWLFLKIALSFNGQGSIRALGAQASAIFARLEARMVGGATSISKLPTTASSMSTMPSTASSGYVLKCQRDKDNESSGSTRGNMGSAHSSAESCQQNRRVSFFDETAQQSASYPALCGTAMTGPGVEYSI